MRRWDLPMILNSPGDFSFGSSGIGRVAADSATSPYLSTRPVDECRILPSFVEHSSGCAPQVCAAAATSMDRAAAPACRRGVQNPRIEVDPPVIWALKRGCAQSDASGGAAIAAI